MMPNKIEYRTTRLSRILKLITLLSCLLIVLSSYSQIIENPALPLAKNAGRVIKLKEVWRITDESGAFFLKYPHDLRIASDGSIFLAEAGEFLKFSGDGKFFKNLYKKGAGPGEIQGEFTYHLWGDNVFVQDMNSQRLWRMDKDGAFKEQVDLSVKDYRGFLGVLPDGFLFLKSIWPPPAERTGRLLEILDSPALVSRDGKSEQVLYTFRPRMFLAPQGGRSWDYSVLVPDSEGLNIYAFHGWDYLIEVLNVSKKQIVRRFKRNFPKVPHVEQSWENDFRKKYGAPKIDYEWDIQGLFVNGPRLWVATAMDDKAKGRLFDLFDSEGRYIDCFYLGAGKTLLAAWGDFLFTQEKNDDETLRIVKYKIEG
jgi:hypothetical protein